MSLLAATRKRKADENPAVDSLAHEDDAKRLRSAEKVPTSLDSNASYDIAKYLAVLDRAQLLAVLQALVADAVVRPLITAMVPRPTVLSVAAHLHMLEKKMLDSFPYSKWGAGKDDYSYNRVRPVLLDLRNAIYDFLGYFSSQDAAVVPSERLHALFSYLKLATSITARLPDWQTTAHNITKREMLARVKVSWKEAIGEVHRCINDGSMVARAAVEEWAKLLVAANSDTSGFFDELVCSFTNHLGWILSTVVQPTQSQQSPAAEGFAFSFAAMMPMLPSSSSSSSSLPTTSSSLLSCGALALTTPALAELTVPTPHNSTIEFGSARHL